MTLHANRTSELTAREYEQMQHDRQMFEEQAKLQIELKRLEVEAIKTDSRWNTLFVLPREILKLPVRILFSFAYIISMFTKKDMPDNYWEWMK